MEDPDYLLARKLQREFDNEINQDYVTYQKPGKYHSNQDEDYLNRTQNLVHPEWETLDPSPDADALFRAFNTKFFQGRLSCVILEWSKRMYSCAGICYTRRNRHGLAVTIRLSEPLLKFRSRKELIETLLHEMIHAYCSVLGIREGNGGHGPNFLKIMNGINKIAGTNITVFHTFHDEVSLYKSHWWRCNGICQHRKPFFGYVKRTCNRAPGPNDIWWRQHLESCGGTFLKIKEPEPKRKMKNPKTISKNRDENSLRKYFPTIPGKPDLNNVKTATSSTVTSSSKTPSSQKRLIPFNNLQNVVGLTDVNDEGRSTSMKRTNLNKNDMQGKGYSLSPTGTTTKQDNRQVDRDKIRNVWASKFSDSKNKTTASTSQSDTEPEELPTKTEPNTKDNIEKSDDWKKVDDDIMIKEDHHILICISTSEESSSDESDHHVKRSSSMPTEKMSPDERQRAIKQEIMDSTPNGESEDEIELVDDDFDKDAEVNASLDLADTSLIDDLFGEDILLNEFKKENAFIATSSKYHKDPNNDIVTCPVCQEKLARSDFSNHIDGCTGIVVKIQPKLFNNPLKNSRKSKALKRKLPTISKSKFPKASTSSTIGQYSSDIMNLSSDDEDENNEYNNDAAKSYNARINFTSSVVDVSKNIPVDVDHDDKTAIEDDGRQNRRKDLDMSIHACPVCAQMIHVENINDHLDLCLK